MKIEILILSVMCAIAVAQDDPTGKSCQSPAECLGLLCEKNKCNCPYGQMFKSYINDRATCRDVLQTQCEGNDECKNLEGVECVDRRCICRDGFVPGRTPIQCLKGANNGEYCEEDSQCTVRSENSKCLDKKCSCDAEHHYDVKDRECIKTALFKDDCDNTRKCYLEKDGENVLRCENSKCICTKETDEACKGGAANVIISMATMVFFVFGVLRVW